jgi:hypothetical protein
MARIQSDAVQLALDLVVRESDVAGFFRAFIKTLVEECESRACGVWLLDDSGHSSEPWMAFVDGAFHTRDAAGWDATALPRDAMAAHLVSYTEGWQHTVEYLPDDPRLPEAVRAFNLANGIGTLQVAPLALPTHTLGWIALASADASACETTWRCAVLEATAQQATLTLHQNRLAEQSRREARRQAALEERNRLARDIHDTLTQGFAAILMQLQARSGRPRAATACPPHSSRGGPGAHAHGRGAPVGRRAPAAGAATSRCRRRCSGCVARASHQPSADRADDQRAAAARRDGARHHRHRPGGADQRRRALARQGIPIRASAVRVDRLAAVGVRRWARDRAASIARAASA